MKRGVAVGAAALGLVLATAWWLASAPPMDSTSENPVTRGSSGEQVVGSTRGVEGFARDAARPRAVPAAPRAAARVLPPTLFGEMVKARQLKPLYDRLNDTPEGRTAEGRLVLYEILKQCATITDRRWRGRPAIPKREELLAQLSPADPLRDKRLAAFDDFTANRCEGFEGLSMTQADLSKILQESAAGGDPRARALVVEQDLWQARRRSDNQATLTDTQIDSLKQAVATHDPEAIRVAGRVLSTTWSDYALRIGPDQLAVEPRPFMNAWLVLSCEYGAACGADTPRMLQSCALQGHCDATNFPDYLYQYGSTPHDSALVMQYRAIIRQALESGDWSQLHVVRGLPNPASRAWFVPGPR